MKVNSISFRGVYRESGKQFSPVQYQISKKITDTMTSPDNVDKRGYTPDEKLKKMGYDLVITPSEYTDTVDVFAVKGVKPENGVNLKNCSEKIAVGSYDNESYQYKASFATNAVTNKGSYKSAFFVPAIAFFALLANGILNNYSNTENSKQPIENIIKKDSLKDSVKTLSADTIKYVKK